MRSYLFLFTYLIIGFVPYFGVIDIIGTQWLYLSVITTIFLLYNLFNNLFIDFIYSIFNIFPFRYYFFFVLLCIFSLIFSQNFYISIIDLSRIIVTILAIINISFIFKKNHFSLRLFSISISIILFAEVIRSLYPLFAFISTNSLDVIDFSSVPTALKGVAGNKNITSADLVFKLPFVLYLILLETRYIRFFSSVLLTVTLIDVFLLSSRAAFISIALIFTIFTIFTIFDSKKRTLSRALFFLLPFSFSFLFIFLTNSISEISVSNRISSISASDTSTNHRLTLYENALDYIYNNPFIGCGIGNWKVESLPYWKTLLTGYIIPYHAHNDFLEVATETGLLGGLLYFISFASIFVFCIKHFYLKRNLFHILLLSITLVYFVDANLNFPLERALSQVNFMIIYVLLILYFNKDEKSFN